MSYINIALTYNNEASDKKFAASTNLKLAEAGIAGPSTTTAFAARSLFVVWTVSSPSRCKGGHRSVSTPSQILGLARDYQLRLSRI